MLLALVLVTTTARSHEEGPPHHEPAAVSATRPQLTPEGQLLVPKPVQRLLGIRTAVVEASPLDAMELLGEVLAHPDVQGVVQSPQTGRIEVSDPGWRLAGQAVKAGDTLAVLRPQMSERERARRRAALALIEQRLNVARINVGRMRTQADAVDGAPVEGNIYLEQAEAEFTTQERLHALAIEGLEGKLRLRAPISGTLIAVTTQPGAVVTAGDPLFEIVDASKLRVAVNVFDPTLLQRIRSISFDGIDGKPQALQLRGHEANSGVPGWRLLLDANSAAARGLLPGQLVPVHLTAEAMKPLGECVKTQRTNWVQVAPELFEKRTDPACGNPLKAGERRVVRGSALLDEYL
ncbi:MAG: HlyD family efflux transporter periplasmic adaptor subunit [Panacagrimonas sp.]